MRAKMKAEEDERSSIRHRDDMLLQAEIQRKSALLAVEIEERRAEIDRKRMETENQKAQISLLQQLITHISHQKS